MNAGTFHFACTQCGACCNRTPEVELGEAAALADRFVFRLMLRVYNHPEALSTYLAATPRPREQASAEFFQTRRQLGAHAVRHWTVRVRRADGTTEWGQYLTLSALALDLGNGACTQLNDGRCGLYDRRPLSCRTVPLHYSRPEAFARHELEEFTARPGYHCDTGQTAPVVLEHGRIADPAIAADRAAAAQIVAADQPWKHQIFRRVRAGGMPGLPTFEQIRDNAERGALTTSMRIAWQIAVEAGMLDANAYAALIAQQVTVIDRLLALPALPPDTVETLVQMRREYAAA